MASGKWHVTYGVLVPPIVAESGRGKGLGRSENKRPETNNDHPSCHLAECKTPLSPCPSSKTCPEMELRTVLTVQKPQKATPIQRLNNDHVYMRVQSCKIQTLQADHQVGLELLMCSLFGMRETLITAGFYASRDGHYPISATVYVNPKNCKHEADRNQHDDSALPLYGAKVVTGTIQVFY
ncbi:hypothetical protein TNCV_685051 [Trichonephila clavipes]|nr:hypothetical protein TNCV_685051 [Trichonephila clavipes]